MSKTLRSGCEPKLLPDRRVELLWADGEVSRFHFVWLRQQHFHPAIGRPDLPSGSPLRLPDDPERLEVERCHIDAGELVVDWRNDGAQTRHALTWLRDNAYDDALRLARKPDLRTWEGVQASQFQWHDWQTLLDDDEALFELFTQLRDRGLARVNNAPVADGDIEQLARRFGELRATDFGVITDIMSRPTAEAGRYANIGAGGYHELAPHTDEGWRYAPPGISFHLCLEQPEGGSGTSRLCDGLLAAERLRAHDPESFEFLTRVPYRFAAARNPQERFFAQGRIIVTDLDEDIVGVRFSDRTLGVQSLPPDLIEPAYRALAAFARELYEADLTYEHLLTPGEMHIFDNHRVLHARAGFDPEAGVRRIQQCSVDREEFHNLLRQLAERLGYQQDANMTLPSGALG